MSFFLSPVFLIVITDNYAHSETNVFCQLQIIVRNYLMQYLRRKKTKFSWRPSAFSSIFKKFWKVCWQPQIGGRRIGISAHRHPHLQIFTEIKFSLAFSGYWQKEVAGQLDSKYCGKGKLEWWALNRVHRQSMVDMR